MGELEETLARQAIRFGNPIPDRIANAPELYLGLSIYFNAFLELNLERFDFGFGPSRIPRAAVIQYAKDEEFDEVQSENLLHFISCMDSAYLKAVREKQKKAAKK